MHYSIAIERTENDDSADIPDLSGCIGLARNPLVISEFVPLSRDEAHF